MRKLLIDPDPRLRKICQDVEKIDRKIKSLARDMIKFIEKGPAKPDSPVPMGLAAPQFGELLKLFVIHTPQYSLTAINPQLKKEAGSRKVQESCLSLPGRLFIIERPKLVKFSYLSLDGEHRTIKLHDTDAQCAMHELGHIYGILIDNLAITEIKKPT